MDILGPVIQPPNHRIRREHSPAEGPYRRFRSCLRWEFGFTCAFCLLHESDLQVSGTEGAGCMTIEHRIPQSSDSSVSCNYHNCFYACRFCNEARASRPLVDNDGRRLLDPAQVRWRDLLEIENDKLVCKFNDPDALYTFEAYALGDPRRQGLRRARRVLITEWIDAICDGVRLLKALIPFVRSRQKMNDLEAASVAIDCAIALIFNVESAKRQLRRFAAIPIDAPLFCKCANSGNRMPDHLRDQLISMPS